MSDILFGDVSPSGKLPITFPKSVEQLPAYEDYNMKGRTYKYMVKEPLFPFGFGLSYTRFEYKNLQIDSNFMVSVDVKNIGERTSDEVVQLYISSPKAGIDDPIYDLKSFKRIHLNPNETKTVRFQLKKEIFFQVNNNGSLVLRKGKHTMYVGGSLPSQRSLDLGSNLFLKTTIKL